MADVFGIDPVLSANLLEVSFLHLEDYNIKAGLNKTLLDSLRNLNKSFLDFLRNAGRLCYFFLLLFVFII